MIPYLLRRCAHVSSAHAPSQLLLLPAALAHCDGQLDSVHPWSLQEACTSNSSGASTDGLQLNLRRGSTTQAKPNSADLRARAERLMMQDEGGRKLQPSRPRASSRAPGALGLGPRLAPAMENVKATLYAIINDTSAPMQEQHRDAVRGLRMMLQEGYAKAKANAAKLQQATSLRSSTSDPPQVVLPVEYRADKQMFNDCIKVLARFYRLPVHHFGVSEYVRRLEPALALEAAMEMEALLVAMDATPNVWAEPMQIDCLLCAWRFANRPDKVRALLQQHSLLGHPAAAAERSASPARQLAAPSAQGVRHAFFALKEDGDINDMWRLLEQVAIRPDLDMGLGLEVNKFVHMLTVAALNARRWDVIDNIQALTAKPTISNKLGMTHSARLMLMAAAAQDDELHLARDALAHLARETRVIPKEYIQQRLKQQEQQQLQGGSGGSANASASTGSMLSRAPSKINEGPLVEVLHACARWPDAAEAKATALQAFHVLERSLSVSNFHPPLYYLQLMGTADAPGGDSVNQLPPPLSLALSAPSTAAHQALVHVLARCGDWASVFDTVARMEQLVEAGVARPVSVSVHRGLGCAAEGIAHAAEGVKTAAAAAYNILAERQAAGHPVSCAMMNIILRGLALRGEVDACSRLFEEYKVAGLPHDLNAYNAVIESCCVAKKPQAAYGVLDYMAAQNVTPNTDSFDLLLRAFVDARDMDGALEALRRLRQGNARARYSTIQAGLKLARAAGSRPGMQAFSDELAALDAYERRQQQLEQEQQQQQLGAMLVEDGLQAPFGGYEGVVEGEEGEWQEGQGWSQGPEGVEVYEEDGMEVYEHEGGLREPYDDGRH